MGRINASSTCVKALIHPDPICGLPTNPWRVVVVVIVIVMELAGEAIAIGTLYKILEMRLELQMFTMTDPRDGDGTTTNAQKNLQTWLDVLNVLLPKVTGCVEQNAPESLLYYKISLIAKGLRDRVKYVSDAMGMVYDDDRRAYYERLHVAPSDGEFVWGGVTVTCLQDAVNLAFMADHQSCILPTAALQEITSALEKFVSALCGRYAVLPPHLGNRDSSCLLCESEKMGIARVTNTQGICDHAIRMPAARAVDARRKKSRHEKHLDFWSLFASSCGDDDNDDDDDDEDDDNGGDGNTREMGDRRRPNQADYMDVASCRADETLPWTGVYGTSPWKTIVDTCSIAKRYAVRRAREGASMPVARKCNSIVLDPNIRDLERLNRADVMREVRDRHRDFLNVKNKRTRAHIDRAMTALRHKMESVLAPRTMSDTVFTLLHSLKRTVANRSSFLSAISRREILDPNRDEVARICAELGRVSLEATSMFQLEEAAFELVVSPRTWRMAKSGQMLPARFAVMANAEFANDDALLRARVKHLCQFGQPGGLVPKTVRDVMCLDDDTDDDKRENEDGRMSSYALYARAAMIFYALGRLTGINVDVFRPESHFCGKTGDNPVVYLDSSDGVVAALFCRDECHLAGDVLHIAAKLFSENAPQTLAV